MMNTWVTAALGEVGGTTAGQWEDARSSAYAGEKQERFYIIKNVVYYAQNEGGGGIRLKQTKEKSA